MDQKEIKDLVQLLIIAYIGAILVMTAGLAFGYALQYMATHSHNSIHHNLECK